MHLGKNPKNLKIVWDHKTQPKTGLSPIGTIGPLGVKPWIQMLHGTSHWKATIHTYILKKFQKLQQLHALTVAYLKVQKAILAASSL
jgi:hypothetical protein